jgi:hypothetical protein
MGDYDWGDQLIVALGDFARYLHINEVFSLVPSLKLTSALVHTTYAVSKNNTSNTYEVHSTHLLSNYLHELQD